MNYKFPEIEDKNAFRINNFSENCTGHHKEEIQIDEAILNYFINIQTYFKSGNSIQLSKSLLFLNNITLESYFKPTPDVFSHHLPNILMRIAFNKSETITKKEFECQVLALSIIDNLTLEKHYGFIDIFNEFNIINSSCLLLLSRISTVISYIIRILINYAELNDEFCEQILESIPLDTFLSYLIDHEINNNELHLYTASLLCQLSTINKKQYVPYFYAAVDFLLKFSDDFNIIKYILNIILNSIQADNDSGRTFTENEDLIGLLITAINQSNENTLLETRLALNIVANFFLLYNFVMMDIDLHVLVNLIDVLKNDIAFPYLLIAFQSLLASPLYPSLLLESIFLAQLAMLSYESSFHIRKRIIILFSSIIDAYPSIDVLETLINNNIIEILVNHLDKTDFNQHKMILLSLIHLLTPVSQMSLDSQSRIINSIESYGEEIFETINDGELSALQSQLNSLYHHIIDK